MRRHLVVTGTPGTGKTTLCREVSNRTGWTHLEIGDLVKERRLHQGYDRRRRSYIVDLERTRKELTGILRGAEQPYLLDSCFAHLVSPPEMVMGAVVLRAHPLEVIRRLARRGMRKAYENAQAEALDVVLIETLGIFRRVHEMDTTGKPVESVANKFLRACREGLPLRVGTAKWLEDLSEKGELELVFREAATLTDIVTRHAYETESGYTTRRPMLS